MTDANGNRIHGGHSSSGLRKDFVDMSTCVDAFGLLPPIERCLNDVTTRAAYTSYPDASSQAARESIAELYNVDPARVDVGPGAAEIIWTLVRTCVRRSDRVDPCGERGWRTSAFVPRR
jgi:histidinol-phosphate/aromatic aminotransferase/cobyric acid decarboxylase-like protein